MSHSTYPVIKLKKLDNEAKLPTFCEYTGGWIFYSLREILILPKQSAMIWSGMYVKIPNGYVGEIRLLDRVIICNPLLHWERNSCTVSTLAFNMSATPHIIPKGHNFCILTIQKTNPCKTLFLQQEENTHSEETCELLCLQQEENTE
jgi:hypothetical protein